MEKVKAESTELEAKVEDENGAVRVMVKGRPQTEEVIPAADLVVSVNRSAIDELQISHPCSPKAGLPDN